jgi:hypothetical protein
MKSVEYYIFKPLNSHLLISYFCYSLMFCVFLHFTVFGKKSFKIHQISSLEQVCKNIKVGKLNFGKIQLQINFEFVCCRKEKSAKICYFWKDFRMSTSLYFNHNFRLKYWIAVKLAALDS